MRDMETEISRIREALEAHDAPRLVIALLFGSAAEGRLGPMSDVDVAVAAPQPMTAEQKLGLIERLAEVTGRPVDVVDLQTAGEPVLGEALSGRMLVLRDPALLAAIARRHLIEVEDFLPLRRRLLDARRKAWIGI